MKIDGSLLIVFIILALVLNPGVCGKSVSVGCGSSVAICAGSSAAGILASDGVITHSSALGSTGMIDNLDIDTWVKDTRGNYAEVGVTGTDVSGFSYSYNYYPDQGGSNNAFWAQQWLSTSYAAYLNAFSRAGDSAGDKAGADLTLTSGSLKNYYNAAYTGSAPWLGIDSGAFAQQTLDNANGNAILAQTWAVDPVGDAAGSSTSVDGALNGYSVRSAAAHYSTGLNAAGVSVDSMSASSTSNSINQIMNTYDNKGDTSTVNLDNPTSVTGYSGVAYAYGALASTAETGHVTGPFIGTAAVGIATKTRTPNFGSQYDLSMSATTGSVPTGTLGYYTDPSLGIQNAVKASQSGDTINAAAGTYNENVVLDKSLTLAGAGETNTIINAVQTDQPVIDITTGNVVVKNLQVTGANANDATGTGAGVMIAGPTDISHVTLDHVASIGNYLGAMIRTDTGSSSISGSISDVNLNNVQISGTEACGVLVRADNGGSISDVNLNNVQISNAGFCGVTAYANGLGSSISDLHMIGGSITGSRNYGLRTIGDGHIEGVVFNKDNIYGNAAGGVNNAGINADTIDARNNWWGDVSGPLNPTSNPGGLGNSISDNVLFDPWATTPYT